MTWAGQAPHSKRGQLGDKVNLFLAVHAITATEANTLMRMRLNDLFFQFFILPERSLYFLI